MYSAAAASCASILRLPLLCSKCSCIFLFPVCQFAEVFAFADCLAVDEQAEALALVVALSVLVVYYCEDVAAIVYVVEAEVRPSVFRHERIDDYAAVSLRAQAYESGDNEVGKCRVVVVAARGRP